MRVDVADLAELAGVDDLLQLRDARVVLEQVADHQHAVGRFGCCLDHALGVGDRLRQRLLDEAVLAGLEAPRAASVGVRRHGGREHDRVELRVGEQVVEVAGEARAAGTACAMRSRALLDRVAAPAQLTAVRAMRSCGRGSGPSSRGRRRRP